jgi:hypothetical protein
MTWFKRRQAVIEKPETDQDRLRIIEDRYRQSKARYDAASEREREYRMSHSIPPELFIRDGKAYVPINATERSDPVYDSLKTKKEHERQAFCRAQSERAEWRKRMGLVK